MPSGRPHGSRHVRLHIVSNESIVAQGTHPGSTLYMKRSVEIAARKTTSGGMQVIAETTGELWHKMLNEVHQEGKTIPQVPEDQDQSIDMIRLKYIYLESVKSVLFTKLESRTSQRQTQNNI